MTKKILSVFLAALMVFSMVPFAGLTAFAGDMPVSHTHAFEYNATGATLTATCTVGCDKNYDTTPLTLTLTEDGFDETALNTWKDAGATEPKITYTNAAGDENLGETKPTEPGKYKVQAVVGSKTAELAFSIADPANITWDYDEGTKTLTLGIGDDTHILSEADNWSDKEVDKVVVASPIAPVSMASWFNGVKEFTGLDKISTDNVTDMTGLFEGSTVSALDISAWKISAGCVVTDMFKDCTNLKKLTAPDSAVAIALPDAPEGKAWELDGSIYTALDLDNAGKVYTLMPVDEDNNPYFTLTYRSDSKEVVQKIVYNATDKAYNTVLLSKEESQTFNSLLPFSKWKDENGNTYDAGVKITLTADTVLYPVWGLAILVKEDGQFTKLATEGTDYTLEDGVLTVLKNGVCIAGMLENTVIQAASDVNELAIKTLTVKKGIVTDPLISVTVGEEKKFTLTVIGDNTVNLANGQSFIDNTNLKFYVNHIPQTGADDVLNINTNNATAITASVIYLGEAGKENSLTVNIADKAIQSSKSAIVCDAALNLYNCAFNVERMAAEDAPAAVTAMMIHEGIEAGGYDNAAKVNIVEKGAAPAIMLSGGLEAYPNSELTVKSATASAVKAISATFDANAKIDISSIGSYALELTGKLKIDGQAKAKDVQFALATKSGNVSAVKAKWLDISAKAISRLKETGFALYSGDEKLILNDNQELVTESGVKVSSVSLNPCAYNVSFKLDNGDSVGGAVLVSGGELAVPPEGYKFVGESEKYYYTPITEDTVITVAETGEGEYSIPVKIPNYYAYVKFTGNVHEGSMALRESENQDNPSNYTFVMNDSFITQTEVEDEDNDPVTTEENTEVTTEENTEVTTEENTEVSTEENTEESTEESTEVSTEEKPSHLEYVQRPINELHELSGRYFIVGDDVQLSDLTLVGSNEIVMILAEGAHVTVKGSNATEEEAAKPAIETSDANCILLVCSTNDKDDYDASLTLVGGNGSEAFPTGASGIKMPKSGSRYCQSVGSVTVTAGKSVGGSEGNFAVDVNEMCIGNGTFTANGTPGKTESAGINTDYLQVGRFATLNAYGAKGDVHSRGVVAKNVYFTNNFQIPEESNVNIDIQGSGNAYAIDSSNIVFEGEVKFNAVGGNGTTTGALSSVPLFDNPFVNTNKNSKNGYSDFDLADCYAGATPNSKYVNGADGKLEPTFPTTAKYISFKTVHHSFMYKTFTKYEEDGTTVNTIGIEAHCINCAIAEDDKLDNYFFETKYIHAHQFVDRDTAEYARGSYINVYCLNCPGVVQYTVKNDNKDTFNGREKDIKATTSIKTNTSAPKVVATDGTDVGAAREAWDKIVGQTLWGMSGTAAGPKLVYTTSDPTNEPLSNGKQKPYYPNQTADGCYKVALSFEYKSSSMFTNTLTTEGKVDFRINKANLALATPAATVYMDEDGDLKASVDPKSFISVNKSGTPGYDATLPATDSYKPKIENKDITCSVSKGTEFVTIDGSVLKPLKNGTAKLHFVIAETKCYNATEADYTVNIKKRPVELPTITTEYQYENGIDSAPVSKMQTIDKDSAWVGFDFKLMSIDGGSVSASEVGTTSVTLKLNDTDRYCWAGDETEAEETTTIDWTITKVDAPEYFTRTVSGENIVIPNRAGKTASFAHPEKVPEKPDGDYAATTYTAGTCSLSKVTGTIDSGNLKLTVGDNHITDADGETFTAELKVSSNNFKDYTVEYTVKPIYHTHNYVSDTVEDNNRALNVRCNSTTDFGCFCENQPKMIEIDYPEGAVGESHNISYTSYPILCQCYAAAWEAGYEDTATNYIKYYELKDGSYVEMTEGQPTIVGTYKAELSIGGRSVEVVYKIIPANVVFNEQPTATVTYGDEVTDGVIVGSMKSAVNGIDVEATETSFAWNSGESYGDAGTKERFAKFTPKDTHNFNVNSDVAVILTVNKDEATEEMKAASLGSIANRVGSTTTIDLSSELPDLSGNQPDTNAKFSNPVVSSGVASASIDGNILSLTIINKHIAKEDKKDPFTVNVSVTDAKNYIDYTLAVSVDVLFHEHNFEYSTDNNAIVATCDSTNEFPSYLASENGTEGNALMRTLNDNPDGKGSCEVKYTGSPIKVSLNAAKAAFWKAETGEDPTLAPVTYTAKEGSSLNADGMAVDVGSYTASYTLHGLMITRDFTIEKTAVRYDETPTAPVTYGDTVEDIDITGTMLSAETGNPVPGTFTWNDAPDTYGDVGTRELTATFIPNDQFNYEVNNAVTVNVIVAKAGATDEMKAASCEIYNRAGSTAELDLTSKLPKGASFGEVTVESNGDIVEASINNNKLNITVNGGHITDANDTFTVKVPVNDATNYNPYTMDVTVDVLFHKHVFAYSKVDNAIVATCDSTNEFPCYLASENKTEGNILMLTLNEKPDGKDSTSTTVVYTGKPVTFSLNAAQAALWKTETGEDPTLTKVTYTAKAGSSLNEKSEAVEAGNYTASYTLHEQTISIDFTIIKADVEVDTLKDVTVTYGTAVSDDVIVGTMKSAKTGAEVPGKFTWNSLETYGDAQTEKKSFTATFTPDDTKNFNVNDNITVKVKVNKTAATEEMKAADSRILNKAGSTAELDLKDKLPAGAKFGTVTVVPEGIATASIVNNVLKLQIAGTDLTDDNNPFEVKVEVKDATNYVDYEIIVTVDVYFHVHKFDTAYTYDESNHWHRCIEENCYIEDYPTCGLEEVAYGEHIGMEDYICDVCEYENIPACKEAAIKLVRSALPANMNHKQQKIADKAIADIENTERVASINEISAKAVGDIAKNAIRCPLCDSYEAQKDIPFFGFILSIVHTFVHLAFSIGRIS
ncbi:MAG: BspA family leucine-rich repeat surface protein [Clostridia bacterium]|nr:BspA family leucine-rich repeat surface protein [Clostridia bacterium]